MEEMPVGAPSRGGLATFAARHRCTVFTVVLAAIFAGLRRASGQSDLSIRVSVNGRPDGFAETIGWFANDTVVRVESVAPTLIESLPFVREAWVGALEHQLVPYSLVMKCVEADKLIRTHRPTTVTLNARVLPVVVPAFGTVMRLVRMSGGGEKAGLHIAAAEAGDAMVLRCAFDEARFGRRDITMLLKSFVDEIDRLGELLQGA
jgi:hypothetical protein